MSDSEAALRERSRELEARSAQLDCLYRLQDLVQDENTGVDALLRKLPAILRSGLRSPQSAYVLLEVGSHRFEAGWDGPKAPPVRESISVDGAEEGAFLVARATDASAPELLTDERALVQTFARRVGEMLAHQRAKRVGLVLDEQLRHVQRAAGGIAHDFNNLLTSIRGLSALALSEIDPTHPTHSDLQEIHNAAQRAASLTPRLRALAKEEVPGPSHRASEGDSGQETILFVESDPAARADAARILQAAGYRVLSAESEAHAADIADGHDQAIHLLLCDAHATLPGGAELYDRIRRHRPRVRVLYMSRYTDDPATRREAGDPGGAFLARPFPPGTLLAEVRRALGRETQTLLDR